MSRYFQELKHAVWRINKWTPFTVLNDTTRFPAPFFAKDADDWLLMRAAQSRLIYIFTLVEKNDNKWFNIDINELSHVVRIMMLSTAAMEFTFDMAHKLTKGKVIDDLDEMPAPVSRFLPEISNFLKKFFGKQKMERLESFFKSDLLNDDGNVRNDDDGITNIQYKEDNTIRIIFAMNVKMLYNPLQSDIASKIYKETNMVPSNGVLEVIFIYHNGRILLFN